MTEQEKIACLMTACRLYHDALDMAFAELIEVTREERLGARPVEQFFPSRSPMWSKMAAAQALMKIVEREQTATASVK